MRLGARGLVCEGAFSAVRTDRTGTSSPGTHTYRGSGQRAPAPGKTKVVIKCASRVMDKTASVRTRDKCDYDSHYSLVIRNHFYHYLEDGTTSHVLVHAWLSIVDYMYVYGQFRRAHLA